MPVDVIVTGRPKFTDVAVRYGNLRGSRLDDIERHERQDYTLHFIDVHWEEPDYEALVEACARHKPRYAVAGDYVDGENIAEVNEVADRLRRHVEHPIVVPKSPGELSEVPEWAVIGYSVPTSYGGTEVPLWEWQALPEEREVHLLGGQPHNQLNLLGYLGERVVSLDGNAFMADATRFNKYWRSERRATALVDRHISEGRMMEAYKRSLNHVRYALREAGVDVAYHRPRVALLVRG